MNIVINYANGLSPQWHTSLPEKNDSLRYLLRGIEECMSFADKVFLVAAAHSQIPEWVDQSALQVVLHKDIIPAYAYLPAINIAATELFHFKIPGIGERFIHMRDDTFPVAKCAPEDFFRAGKIVGNAPSKKFFAFDIVKRQLRNISALARHTASLPPSLRYLHPKKGPAPMLAGICEEVFLLSSEQIEESLFKFGDAASLDRNLFTDYTYLTGRMIPMSVPCRDISCSSSSMRGITHPTSKFVCIDDSSAGKEQRDQYSNGILEAFESRFPNKSKFEKI